MMETNSLVVFEPCPKEEKNKCFSWRDYKYLSWRDDFYWGETVLFLGEIKQMPGHCIVATKEGKVIWGYHTENFRLATEDEI